jgi:hypothetical protein
VQTQCLSTDLEVPTRNASDCALDHHPHSSFCDNVWISDHRANTVSRSEAPIVVIRPIDKQLYRHSQTQARSRVSQLSGPGDDDQLIIKMLNGAGDRVSVRAILIRKVPELPMDRYMLHSLACDMNKGAQCSHLI